MHVILITMVKNMEDSTVFRGKEEGKSVFYTE